MGDLLPVGRVDTVMDDRGICPLKVLAKPNGREHEHWCEGEDCAWWLKDCAVKVIAEALLSLRKYGIATYNP
ncbi:MAG: hypothetical protein HPY58_14005 [Firmicutes bacterium]|nr:hypothetical protein [Bacillota bacterium]